MAIADDGVCGPKPRGSEVVGFLPKCIKDLCGDDERCDCIGMRAVFCYYSCYCCFCGKPISKIFHCIKIHYITNTRVFNQCKPVVT